MGFGQFHQSHSVRFVLGLLLCCVPYRTAEHPTEDQQTLPTNGFVKGHDCPAGCATCSTLNGCITCQRTYLLHVRWHGMRQTGVCVQQCPTGYYPMRKRKHAKCSKCSIARCELCTNSTACAQCVHPFAMYNGQCVDHCPVDLPHVNTLTGQCTDRVDCEVGQWSFWTTCSRKGLTCGYKYGRHKRQRSIVQSPTANGLPCPRTVETRRCKMKYRYCEDLLTNKSELSRTLNNIPRQKWLRLLLRYRKRKQRDDAHETGRTPTERQHGGGRRQQTSTKPNVERRRRTNKPV